ncbi:sporulation protein YtfJ [Desulfuribacillus stibiiarsenatis]|uniref:Sporulation protein YtfJ n=1 Tax=Desulfuribacillus stibiiarsenatis TaxID=1390249 RepID=A0A1E5L6N4_9FIRM|nr:GerW family sporulation protein [Desulfuribacillus stibiiarsenatis]OEH85718.1 sporulation protein YtfJ [Desulfuribacillus stibiiarsenatis]
MSNHPIQNLMSNAMENLKTMIDVNTIVGDAVETPDGSIIIPVSKVGFAFAAGGTEFDIGETKGQQGYPFGGGSGGGVSISPVAFLVINRGEIRLLPLDNNIQLLDRIVDLTPEVIDKIQKAFSKEESKPQY